MLKRAHGCKAHDCAWSTRITTFETIRTFDPLSANSSSNLHHLIYSIYLSYILTTEMFPCCIPNAMSFKNTRAERARSSEMHAFLIFLVSKIHHRYGSCSSQTHVLKGLAITKESFGSGRSLYNSIKRWLYVNSVSCRDSLVTPRPLHEGALSLESFDLTCVASNVSLRLPPLFLSECIGLPIDIDHQPQTLILSFALHR